MVIGVDIRSLQQPYGGIPEYTRALVRMLTGNEHGGHTYILFANSFGGSLPSDISLRGPHHEVCRLRIPNKVIHASQALSGRPFIDELIKRRCGARVDLLFFPNICFIGHSSHVPRVVTVHDLSFVHCADLYSRKSRLWHLMTRPRSIISEAAHVLAVSAWTRHDVMRVYGVPEHRITVTPLAQSIQSAELRRDENERNLILLFGADNLRKNARAAIEAFDTFRACSPNARRYTLVLVGSTRARRDRRRLTENGMIQFRPGVTDEERSALYAHAAALLYPSIMEGFGLPLLEATAFHVPIITANHSSIGEVIGTGAYYVNPFDSGELARALHDVLNDAALRQSLIRDAQKAVRRFSWQKTAQITRAVFERVV